MDINTHTLKQSPSLQPLKDIMDRAMAAERGGAVLNASVFGGFPMADIPHVGFTVVLVADGETRTAETLRDQLLDEGVVDGALHQKPRAGDAHLTAVAEDAHGRHLGRLRKVVRVVEHDVG